MIWRLFILSVGVFCAATSVVMTKASQLAPEHLSASRLFVAAFVLLPLFLRDKKRFPEFTSIEAFRIASLPASLLALHFITWTIGARWTSSANSTLIVNLIPVAMPFFGYFVLREKLSGTEALGTALTILGIGVLALADFRMGSKFLLGDLVCLISMLLMAWYLILSRKYKSVPSIWLYLTPLYAMAGVLCLVAGLLRTGFPESASTNEWIYILLLGLVPTVCGHTLLNLAMRWFRSQLVAIVNQLQFVYAGILGYFFFSEIPDTAFYLASACMIAGVFLTIRSNKTKE